MKISFVQKLLYFVLLFIQVGFVIAVFMVNHLANTKAGVYRHVYTRKMQYMEGLYNPGSIQWQSLFAACLCIALIVLLFISIKKNKGLFYKLQIVAAILLGFFVLIVMNSELFTAMMAYPYMIMVFQLVFFIQLIIVIILGLNRLKQ